MTALLLQHGLVAALGLSAITLPALLLRAPARDPVLRYRLLLCFLPLALLALPAQLAVVELAPTGARAYLRDASGPLAGINLASWLVGLDGGRIHATGEPGREPSTGPAAVRAPRSPRSSRSMFWRAVAFLWPLGALAGCAFCAARIRVAALVLRHCRPVTHPGTLAVWNALANVRLRTARLLECRNVASPFCWGLGRSAVVIPAGAWNSLGPARLELALRHELTHLRRRDPLLALLQMALKSLYWFHPLVWLYCRALDQERELSCDALVVRATRKPRSYALTLLECCRGAPLGAPAAGFAAAVSIQRRLHMIEKAHPASRRARLAVSAGLLAGLVLAAASHATVAAAMGPAPLRAQPQQAANGAPRVDLRVTREHDGAIQAAAIHALTEGREDQAVFHKWSAFMRARDADYLRNLAPGAWMTDQETALSAERATMQGATLSADEALLNLPEGSGLKAELRGKRVVVESDAGTTNLTLHDGEARILDRTGVARFVAQAGVGAELRLSVSLSNGEVVIAARASDGPVRVQLDVDTGVPHAEEQPPHGAIRWKLLTPDEPGAGLYRVKMQWIYDMYALRRSVEGAKTGGGDNP